MLKGRELAMVADLSTYVEPTGVMVLYDGLRRTGEGCPDQWEANVTGTLSLYIRARHGRIRVELVGAARPQPPVCLWEAPCPDENAGLSTPRMVELLAQHAAIVPTPAQLAQVAAMGESDDDLA